MDKTDYQRQSDRISNKSIEHGTLFLIVGNSGAGKDSIIVEIQKIWPEKKLPLRVARRYITRLPHESEPYISIEPDEFVQMKKQGEFFLTWRSFGFDYAIGKEVYQWLLEGINVLVNASRAVIPDARRKAPWVNIIFVSVPLEITFSRLTKRNREAINGDEFKKRLLRAKNNQKSPDADFTIENIGPLNKSAIKLKNYIISILESKKNT